MNKDDDIPYYSTERGPKIRSNLALDMDHIISISKNKDGSVEFELANGEIHVLYEEEPEEIELELLNNLSRITTSGLYDTASLFDVICPSKNAKDILEKI